MTTPECPQVLLNTSLGSSEAEAGTLNTTLDIWTTVAAGEVDGSENVNGPTLVCRVRYLYFTLISLGAVCVLGFVGNIFTALIMNADRKTSATSLLLISLAVVDEFVLLGSFFRRALPAYCGVMTVHNTWAIFCHVQSTYMELVMAPVFLTAHMATTWMTVQVAGTLIFAVAFNLPKWAMYSLTTDESGTVQLVILPWVNQLYKKIYEEALYTLFIFILPLLSLTFFTTNLLVHLRSRTEKREAMSRSKQASHDITLALVLVVLVFMVCQLVNPIRRYIYLRDDNKRQKCFFHLLSQLAYVAIALNSAVNFLIYSVCAVRFRRKLISLLCKGNSAVAPSSSVPNTIQNALNQRSPNSGTNQSGV